MFKKFAFATTIAFLSLFLLVFSSTSLLFAGEEVSSMELIRNAEKYNGETITYEGEVIGDVMCRGEYGWINVSDGENIIGIWCKREDLEKIKFAGSYKIKGDKVRISGIFNSSCSQHQGELDIHAQELEVVESGREIMHPLNTEKAKLMGILAIAALGFFLLSLLRKSSLKESSEPASPSFD